MQYNRELVEIAENEKYLEMYKSERGNRESVNLVVAGHVESGKSTLIGQLLYSLKIVGEKEMRKNEKESKMMNKESFKYAWVTDCSDLEREKGLTLDVGYI